MQRNQEKMTHTYGKEGTNKLRKLMGLIDKDFK
jgi:hypothetical protein